MSSTTTLSSLRIFAPAAAALVLIGMGATPSSAQQDPGPSVAAVAARSSGCPLERVGAQFVRCDDLTGNGVPAPTYIPEQ